MTYYDNKDVLWCQRSAQATVSTAKDPPAAAAAVIVVDCVSATRSSWIAVLLLVLLNAATSPRPTSASDGF